MPEPFLVDYVRGSGTVVVRFIAELDRMYESRAQEAGLAALSELDDDGAPFVIDVGDLSFCDSSG